MSKSVSVERLLQLLGDELELCGQIRELTEEQTQFLDKDDLEKFNISLERREELIQKIKGLHQESKPLMQSYVSLSSSDKEKSSEVDRLNKRIREALEFCALHNDRNISAMKEKTQEHTKKIDEQSAKRKGIGGYAQAVPNTSGMFDKKT